MNHYFLEEEFGIIVSCMVSNSSEVFPTYEKLWGLCDIQVSGARGFFS